MRYSLVASLFWFGLLGFENFLPPLDISSDSTETSYLLVANTTDNLTTPGGDKITLPQ